MNLHIRWSIRRDLPAMLEIERQSFPRPWNEEDFTFCLRDRKTIGMVCEDLDDDHTVGFFIYELHKRHLQVVNFAVAPSWRRRGVGTLMAVKLLAKLSSGVRGRDRIRLFVPERNLGAQLFWAAAGFKASVIEPSADADDDDGYIKFVHRLAVGEPNPKVQ